jgi:hypothetical protein
MAHPHNPLSEASSRPELLPAVELSDATAAVVILGSD